MISKRRIKIGATYKTNAWWADKGRITITDIVDDVAEVVYDEVDPTGKLIKRRCIGQSPVSLLRVIIIKEIKYIMGEAINDN